jgi:hypothetical protein
MCRAAARWIAAVADRNYNLRVAGETTVGPDDAHKHGLCSEYEGLGCLASCGKIDCARKGTVKSLLDEYNDAVRALLDAVLASDTNATIEAVDLVERLRIGLGIK